MTTEYEARCAAVDYVVTSLGMNARDAGELFRLSAERVRQIVERQARMRARQERWSSEMTTDEALDVLDKQQLGTMQWCKAVEVLLRSLHGGALMEDEPEDEDA